jgi:dTDP-4-dehydrorhamnose reductase
MDAADTLLNILEKEILYGVYHIGNDGEISYMDFVRKIKELLNIDAKLIECYDSRFPPSNKPSYTPIVSVKLPKLRKWDIALKEYLNEVKKKM